MTLTKYVSWIECAGYPLDEFGILTAAICTGKHVGIMMNAMEFWTSRDDNNWEECDIYFAFIGDGVFIPIERLDMSFLNKVAQGVPLCDTLSIKQKRGRKKKSDTSTEEKMTGIKKIKNSKVKQKANEMDSKKVESPPSQPKRRGRKRKNDDDTSKPKIQSVVRGKRKREQKPKKGNEMSNAETSEDVVTKKKRGRKPTTQENENVVKKKRGRPKIRVIIDDINNNNDDDDFREQPQLQPKRKVYKRESKSKGRVFIKSVTSKNKNGKKEKKHDLEREFNDIDAMLENMDMADTTEMSVDGNDNGGKSNQQVPSTHQIEKELCERKLQQMKEECAYDDGTEINGLELVNNTNQQIVKIKTECIPITETDVAENIVTDGIVTYGNPSIGMEGGTNTKITDETANVAVTDGVGTEAEINTKITDETANVAVADGVGTEAEINTKITDETANVAVADGVGTEAEMENTTKLQTETANVDNSCRRGWNRS